MDSNAFDTTSMKDVVRMATLLRDKGDRLLNSSCKLTLTVEFLVKLNEAFDMIVENVDTSCFQVINTNNSSIEFLHDLQFLHDLVQKILGLSLWNRRKIPVYSVRLEKFRSLEYLDLHGVKVRNIKVSCMRDKLKSLNCTHCSLKDLREILSPDEDFVAQESGCINFDQRWMYLEEMFLPYNAVEVIGSSLLYVPRLKLLDLSHNLLTDLTALEHSTGNLELLNVSYNRLKSIPVFSNCTKLKVLLVNDNQLADVAGLNNMPSLQQINASNNLLRDHNYLGALSNLLRIEKLQLQGNPIAFKKGHRLLTISHLNPLVLVSGKFQLDGRILSPMEQSHLYMQKSYGTENVFNSELSGSCLNHISSCNYEEPATSEYQNIISNGEFVQSHSLKVGVPVGTRPVRIREASIADEEEYFSNVCKEPAPTSGTAVHLETKRNIETLRKNVGEENWLRGGGGQKVLNILGLPMKTSVAAISLDSVVVSLPSEGEPLMNQVVHQSDGNATSSYDKAEEVQEGVEDGEMRSDDDKAAKDEENEVVYLHEQEEKDNGAELGVFVVQRGRFGLPMDDLLLRVTDRQLIECNVANGMEMARRTLSNLVGVSQENVSGDENGRKSIRLTFRDSYSMEALSYFMEDEESKELLKLIGEMLEMKYSNSSEHDIQFTCMRCSATFVHSSFSSGLSSCKMGIKAGSIEKNSDVAPKCPKCSSAAVVQNIVEEASNFPQSSGDSQLQDNSTLSNKNLYFQHSEHKDPIAQWAEINFIDEVSNSSEAVVHGLHLHILLNILPDDQGKEFDMQDVLVFQGNSGDAFCGHIVISGDNFYVLKEIDALETEGRRSSVDEHSAPILVERHTTQNCLSVVKIHSGYFIKFAPEPPCSLWVFPRHHKKMEEVMEVLCSTLKDKQLLLVEDQRINENRKLSEIILVVPAAAITCLTCSCETLESSVNDSQYGILVLTSSVIFFVNHRDVETFVSNSEFIPTYERRIADLVSLNGATSSVHQLPGILLHFSSEEHDDKCMVWPWGNGALLDFLYSLQKPWEDIFSVPFETILAQTAAGEY